MLPSEARKMGIWRRICGPLSFIIFVLVAISSMPLIQIVGSPYQNQPIQNSDSPEQEHPTGDDEPEPRGLVPIQVTNPSPFPREKEIVWYKLILKDFQLWDASQVYVRNAVSGTEVLSGALASTAMKYPSGFIREVDVVFQDDFGPNETKSYQVVFGIMPSLTGDIDFSVMGTYVYVDDGPRQYEIQTSHDISFWTQGVYVYYSNGSTVHARSSILVRVGGNQFCLDQTNFQLAWGPPTKMEIDKNNVMVSVYLEYRNPIMVNWGRGIGQDIFKNVDSIYADVRINIYNDRPLIETFAKKKINEKFYNHNGFVMEFSVLYAGQGEYQAIYGNSNHTIMTGKTQSYYWEPRGTTLFDPIDVGNISSPEFANLDDDGDFDLIIGDENGTLVYYENTGTPFSPVWTLDPTMFSVVGDLGNNTAPDLTDLDGDFDLDLTVGVKDGLLFYYENEGDPTTPSWTNKSAMYSGMDVGNYSTPKLEDLDGDGDFDLSIGKDDGTIVYYENTGDATTPIWTKNDTLFYLLNTGNTKKPGLYSTPEFADIDADGDLDFISGTDESPYMAVNVFLNEGDTTHPWFITLRPDMVNSVRGGSTAGDRDFSSPEMVDINGDGDIDFAIGFADGTISFWENMGKIKAERGINYMEPMENGSYRFFKDQDGNDGQYVINNYSDDFWDYYVVANPATGAAILRYVPEFAEMAYRDRYAGDEYPWAGGNVSYYPFIPEIDGYVTRGIAVSRVFYDPGAGTLTPGMMGGTFLSQTGTAGGFIQVPMTATSHDSKEVLLLEMSHTTNYSVYDLAVERLKTEMVIEGLIDLIVTPPNLSSTPAEPEEGDLVVLEAVVRNQGQERADDVDVEFYDGNPDLGGTQIGQTITIASIEADSSESTVVGWDTAGKAGVRDIFVRVDFTNTVFELDDMNNNATRQVYVTDWFKNWGKDIQITSDLYNNLDPAIVEDSDGKVWIAWHSYATDDNFDIFAKNYSSGSWSAEEPVAVGVKRTSRPSLAADNSGNVWVAYSSNIIEYNDFIVKKSGIYYWSQKFDIYAKKFDGTQWLTEDQISYAEVLNHSDQTPWVIVTSKGEVWVTYRHTHFQLYTAGYQMYNIPYQDMNISAVMHDGVSWSSEIVIDNSSGAQGWWGGPRIVEDKDSNIWIIYGSEIMNMQWDIFAIKFNGTNWSVPVKLTTSPAQDMRPSACVDADGNLWVAWESMRTGNKDIFTKYYNGTDWSGDIQLTTDTGWDIKSAITADKKGNVWVAWESDRNGNKDIYLKRYNSSQWSHDIQVTTDTHSDDEVALVAGNVTGNIWLAWETDRNGHGNKDIYAKMLDPTSIPIGLPQAIEGLAATIQDFDIVLDWAAPVSPDLHHYLIYRSENQTDFDFTTPHHDTTGDVDPLSITWVDVGAANPTGPSRFYYTVRPVDSFGRMGFTNGTIGTWRMRFDPGLKVFSLPLEPGVLRNVSFYVNDIPNAQYIKWMDSNGRWVRHDLGMGPGVNDATVRMGEAYEIFLTDPTNYTFTGSPASMIRHRVGFGDSLANRYSLAASVINDDVLLSWDPVQGAYYYLVYKAQSRTSLSSEEPTVVTRHPVLTWNDSGVLSSDGDYYYMIIPMDDTGEMGSSSYSVGVVRRTFAQGVSTFALVVEIEERVTLSDLCSAMPGIVGMAYMTMGVWKFHPRQMPSAIYDVGIMQGEGYLISTRDASTRFTFIGY